MTQDGQFHLFPLPSPGISVTSIVAGPDGNLSIVGDPDHPKY
jgi:hypothetical protein